MIRGILILTLVIGVLVAGYQFAEPPVQNYMLEGKMKDSAKAAGRRANDDQRVRVEIMKWVEDKDIPLPAADLVVVQENETIEIAASYSVTVDFLGYEKTYHFTPATSEEARKHYAFNKSQRRR
jgi:hypothetical protein